jgi:hypothetical protein
MDNELRHPLTELTSGSMLRLQNGQGLAVTVFDGDVWITQEDDLRDTILSGGESFCLDRPGLTLVQAFRDSKLMLLECGPRREWTTAASSYDLHRQAQAQRSAAIGQALSTGFAALANQFRHAFKRPTPRAAMARAVCHA